MKITEKVFDVNTGETTILERNATEIEIAEAEEFAKLLAAKEAEAVAKESARQALLNKLGITADEAKLLLG
jgi:hypothetical protein